MTDCTLTIADVMSVWDSINRAGTHPGRATGYESGALLHGRPHAPESAEGKPLHAPEASPAEEADAR